MQQPSRGKKANKTTKNWRLPKRILRKSSKDEILFHQALFYSGTHRLWIALRIFLTDYIPNRTDIILFASLISSWFVPPLFMIVVGLLFGYMFASLTAGATFHGFRHTPE
ncbi:MAG: hypothetical protein P8163_09075 [Candidatus Thiodiazotropha sp.]